jgi:hypothetical protein
MQHQRVTNGFPTSGDYIFGDILGAPPDPKKQRAAAAGPRNGSENANEVTQLQEPVYHGDSHLETPSSALDLPIGVTRFKNVRAREMRHDQMSLREFVGIIQATRAPDKSHLPLLKLATFGDQRTKSQSLRHDANLSTITGIEGDYDAGQVSAQDAAEMLREAGLAAVIYTSTHNTARLGRWRVLVPLSKAIHPSERDALCERLNGALGGILGPESFTRSQSFYFGAAEMRDASKGGGRAAPLEVLTVEGAAIDQVAGIPLISKSGPPCEDDLFGDLLGDGAGEAPNNAPERVDRERLKSALGSISDADDRDTWLRVGMALHHESNGDNWGYQLWCSWSEQSLKFDSRDQRATWRSFRRDAGGIVTGATILSMAMDSGWNSTDVDSEFEEIVGDATTKTEVSPTRLTFLSPSDCEQAPSRSYVIKGLLAEGDVACVFGAPGAGKSLLTPFLGYAVAQGQEAFGMRSKSGGVFYVAAEDPHGMRGRVKALRSAHGDAPDFQLVEGVSNLLVKDAPDLKALLQAVKDQRPKLVIIDTLAMAFPGLEENSAEAMGRVVAVARALTKWGAAVILVHHDTKAEGATPRGHSLLNGALDVAVHVKRDEGGIIRGKLTKNRNGSCDRDIAFRIAVEDGGRDEDGDQITLPRCDELSGSDDLGIQLTQREAAALDVLCNEIAVETDFDDLSPDGPNAPNSSVLGISSDVWRIACSGDKRVSDSEKSNSRNVAFKRARDALVTKGVVIAVTDPVTGAEVFKPNETRGLQ